MLSALVAAYLALGGAGTGALFVACVLSLLVPARRIAGTPRGQARVASSLQARPPSWRLSREGAPCGASAGAAGGSHARMQVPSRYQELFVPLFLAAAAALAVGVVCLAVDLGRADRLMLVIAPPRVTYIAVGSWAIALSFALSLANAAAWGGAFRLPLAVVRALAIAGAVCAVVGFAYTGLLLASVAAVPLWSTWALPVLFSLSALSSGMGLCVLATALTDAAERFSVVVRRMMKVDLAVIALEAVAVVALVATVSVQAGVSPFGLLSDGFAGSADAFVGSGAAASEDAGALAGVAGIVPGGAGDLADGVGAASGGVGFLAYAATPTAAAALDALACLLAGGQAPVFWGLFIGVGMAAPLVAEAATLKTRARGPVPLIAIGACALVGAFALRFCIVAAGMHPAITTLAGI